MTDSNKKAGERGTCEVCKRNFKLVGKNPAVLANHGFKVSTYGQTQPCLGAGFAPEKSLPGAIEWVKAMIKIDKPYADMAWRAERNEKMLEWLLTR